MPLSIQGYLLSSTRLPKGIFAISGGVTLAAVFLALVMLKGRSTVDEQAAFRQVQERDTLTTAGDFALVLDDYHVITVDPIHRAMTYLMEHLPPQLHLVILTRADPPLPLSRLRARGQLIELSAADLRFSSEEASEEEEQLEWALKLQKGIHTFAEGGVYTNFLGDEGEEQIRASYGINYERLVALKNKYDPTNFFRYNQNIKPTV